MTASRVPFTNEIPTQRRANSAADQVESQVLQLFEADATFTRVEPLAAFLVFAGEPG
jgi:hypothetical protein